MAAAFQRATTTALGADFEGSVERALLYPIGVFAISFLMVFAIPTPARRAGLPSERAAAH